MQNEIVIQISYTPEFDFYNYNVVRDDNSDCITHGIGFKTEQEAVDAARADIWRMYSDGYNYFGEGAA